MTPLPSDGIAQSCSGRSEVRVLTRFEEFAALRSDWNALLRGEHRDEVFLTHEWFDAAWQWRRDTADLFLLCLYREGKLTAVLPLVRDRQDSAVGRDLSVLSVPDTQYCDVVTAHQDREAAASAFARELALRRSEWDVLRLPFVRTDAVSALELPRAIGRYGIPNQLDFAGRNAYLPLDGTWNAYYATRSRSLKKANNLCANRIRKTGDVEVKWFEPGNDDVPSLDRFVDEVIGISARSWKTRTANSLDNPGPQAFIRRLSHLAGAAGWLSIWVLTLDGRPLAMEYQLVAGGNVYALRSDFAASSDDISPGSHLSRVLLERLFGRGLRRYYMGPGNNPYKFRWTDQSEAVGTLMAFSPSARGRMRAAWQLGLRPVLRRLRDRLQPSGTAGAKR